MRKWFSRGPSARARLSSVLWALAFVLSLFAVHRARGDDDWVYAVQLTAQVQVSPPRITLSWEPDLNGPDSYTVYRKSRDATTWGSPVATLSGSATGFIDNNVVAGNSYEYQVVKVVTDVPPPYPYTGYGYIYSGINVPLTEGRGKLLLIVATNSTQTLSTELARLQSDLTGDGWQVIRHDVSSNDTPDHVRTVITNDYYADAANVSAVFLFGHVPVLQSGELNYDTHATRPMPADAFYGEMNPDWPTDSSNSPSYLPSDVKLMVGRVDFFDMPGVGAPVAWPSETELLRNYLNKDHNWRFKLISVPHRALMGDSRGFEDGLATAASGYRAFDPLVGVGNTIQADVQNYDGSNELHWISMLANGSYLWAYGNGAGAPNGCGSLGTNIIGDNYSVLLSTDVVARDAKAVFVMLFGSWFGEWDFSDDLMRSFLATPTMGLACFMAGVPHWYVHHMGLGEPIGFSTRLTMNNSTLYQSQTNIFTRAVYIALMGDPTLRQDLIAPPSNLSASPSPTAVNLQWSASPESVLGYNVYRSTNPAGPFTRLNGSLLSGNSFSDSHPPSGTYTYMVRAVALQTTPSGTYFNASQGVFGTATFNNGLPTIFVGLTHTANSVTLSWNTVPGSVYHVQANTGLDPRNWTDASGAITATASTTAWTDTNIHSSPQRFYRVVGQ